MTASGITRRRSLRLIATTAMLPLAELAGERSASRFTWRGVLLGGHASLTLAGLSEARARQTIIKCLDEIARLERMLSLYQTDSALVELNRSGLLTNAPAELRTVVAAAIRMARLSDGAFDATVQPLWQALARSDEPDAVRRARHLVDGTAVEIAGSAIRLPRPGMALTLNGIAQGYITDRVAELLADYGLHRALLELGEIRALGCADDGRPWRVGLRGTQQVLELSGGACATSAVGPTEALANVVDPRTGLALRANGSVTVRHRSAMWADAMSTALCVAGRKAAPALLAATGADEALFVDGRGHTISVTSA